jgi:hypothetical protein
VQEAWCFARQAERGFTSRLRGLLPARDSYRFAGRVSTDKRASVYEYRVNSRVVGRSETIARWLRGRIGWLFAEVNLKRGPCGVMLFSLKNFQPTIQPTARRVLRNFQRLMRPLAVPAVL